MNKALSIRQPWAWLIAQGFKDIENRTWTTRYRGPLLIQASKGMTRDEYGAAVMFLQHLGKSIELPAPADLARGGIVGAAELVDCVERSISPWFVGRYGFVLRDARAMPFMPLPGALGLFSVPG